MKVAYGILPRIWIAILVAITLAGCATGPAYTPWPSFSNMTADEKAVVRASFAFRETEEAALRLAHERFGTVVRPANPNATPALVPVLVPPGSLPRPKTLSPWEGWEIDIVGRSPPALGIAQSMRPTPATANGWLTTYAGDDVALGRSRTRDVGRYDDRDRGEDDPGIIRESTNGYYERPENYFWNYVAFGDQLESILESAPAEPPPDTDALLLRAVTLGYRDHAARAAFLRELDAAMRAAIRRDDFETISTLFVASGLSLVAWTDGTLELREAGLEYLRGAYIRHQTSRFADAASLAIDAGKLFHAAVDLELAKVGLSDKTVRDAVVDEMLKPPVTYRTHRTIDGYTTTTEITIYPPTFKQPDFARFSSRLQAVAHQAPIAYAYGYSYYLAPPQLADRLEQLAYEFRDRFDGQTASVFLDFAARAHAMAGTPVHDVLALSTALRTHATFMRADIAFSMGVDPWVSAGLAIAGADVKGRARRRCPDYVKSRRALLEGMERPSYAKVEQLLGKPVASDMEFADRLCKESVKKLPKN